MDWKAFLKPNWKKLSLFVAITSIVILLARFVFGSNGYPLPLSKVLVLGEPGQPIMLAAEPSFTNIITNVLLVVFWYLLSCLLVFAFNKLKR